MDRMSPETKNAIFGGFHWHHPDRTNKGKNISTIENTELRRAEIERCRCKLACGPCHALLSLYEKHYRPLDYIEDSVR